MSNALNKSKIAVVLPSYNEKKNLSMLIERIRNTVPSAAIIVVDDNSTDGTKIELQVLQKKINNLYVLSRTKKEGRGSAVILGFKYAQNTLKAKIFVEMDSDLSHDPKEIIKMLSLSKPKTVVIASRYLKTSKIKGVSFKRKLVSKLSNFIIQLMLKSNISDNTNGFRCFSDDAIKILLRHTFVSSGYIVLSEVIFVLQKNKFSFLEFPSVFNNRKYGKSKADLREFLHGVLMLIKIKNL